MSCAISMQESICPLKCSGRQFTGQRTQTHRPGSLLFMVKDNTSKDSNYLPKIAPRFPEYRKIDVFFWGQIQANRPTNRLLRQACPIFRFKTPLFARTLAQTQEDKPKPSVGETLEARDTVTPRVLGEPRRRNQYQFEDQSEPFPNKQLISWTR